jgi:hypothetical protein
MAEEAVLMADVVDIQTTGEEDVEQVFEGGWYIGWEMKYSAFDDEVWPHPIATWDWKGDTVNIDRELENSVSLAGGMPMKGRQ